MCDFIKKSLQTKKSKTFLFYGYQYENFLGDIVFSNDETKNKKIQQLLTKYPYLDSKIISASLNFAVNDIINNVSQSNKAGIVNQAIAVNQFTLDNLNSEGDVNIFGIGQETKALQETYSQITQIEINKIKTDLNKDLGLAFKPTNKNNQESLVIQILKESSNLDRDLKIVDDLAKVMTGFTNSENKEKLEKELISIFQLPNDFKLNSNDEIRNRIENNVNQENLATCSSQAFAKNEIELKDLDFKEEIEISDIKQIAIASSILSCTIDQKLESVIENNISTSVKGNVSKIMDSIPENKIDVFLPILIASFAKIIESSPKNLEEIKKDILPENKIKKEILPENKIDIPSKTQIIPEEKKIKNQPNIIKKDNIMIYLIIGGFIFILIVIMIILISNNNTKNI